MTENLAVFKAAADAHEKNLPAALATVIQVDGSVPRHVGSKMLIYESGEIVGTVGGGAMEARIVGDGQAAIRDGQSRTVSYTLNDIRDGDPGICGGTVTVFVEPLQVRATLLVIGCGHVGKALAQLGKWAGFRVVVSDDRAEYCNPAYIPNMDEYIVCKPGEIAQQVRITPKTFVAAVTRGLPVDEQLIPALLQTDAAYLGLIGSRRRWALTAKALADRGVTPEQLDRIHAPIGLELQAETPEEIAISILAEIIMVQRGGDGRPMKAGA
jgi:xanthine dehydrogenase accessory factor